METEAKDTVISRRTIFLIVLLSIVVLGASAWFIWNDVRSTQEGVVFDPAETTNSEAVINNEKTSEKPVVITENKTSPPEDPLKAKMPSLTRAIPVGASPDSVQKINEAVGLIKDNYNYLQAWLQLGLLRNSVKDYEGAIEAWKFATILRPQSSTAFLNLGDVYGWYLHDNVKAESYLLAGIAAEPKDVYSYYKTYEFYMDIMKDAVKARKILEQGIAENPDSSEDLKQALNNL